MLDSRMSMTFLLRDVRHAKRDIFLLHISAIRPEAISDVLCTSDTKMSKKQEWKIRGFSAPAFCMP